MLLVKTFFFLRIFNGLTRLVIMIKNVIDGLGPFLLFYLILTLMCSNILSILGLDNYSAEQLEQWDGPPPGAEYRALLEADLRIVANFLAIIRYSLGDFQFESVQQLDQYQGIVFWLMWIFMVTLTCVIFLNFIIAEVSQSYMDVQLSVNEFIHRERARLIHEAEVMLPNSAKDNKEYFPRFLIMR